MSDRVKSRLALLAELAEYVYFQRALRVAPPDDEEDDDGDTGDFEPMPEELGEPVGSV